MKKTIALALAISLLAAVRSSAQTPPAPLKLGPADAEPVPSVRARLAWGGAAAEPGVQKIPPSVPKPPESPPQPASTSPYLQAGPSLGAAVTGAGPPSSPLPPETPPAPARFWAGAEYLLWWTQQGRLPPLVTASTPSAAAILGPNTAVLFGGSRLDNEERSGGRFLLGGWLDAERSVGLEAGYLFLGTRTVDFRTGGDGSPGSLAVGRPFFDVVAGAENSQLIAFPGLVAGTVRVTESTSLQGWEGNSVYNLFRGPTAQIDALLGFRYLQLNEGLRIGEDLSVLPDVAGLGGTGFRVTDQFETRNRFYGGQLGARGQFRWGNWSLTTVAKVALGDSHQIVAIDGSTIITPPAGSGLAGGAFPGGLLALPSNIGRYHRDEFAVVPEGTINLGYWVTRYMRATVGYTFLYYSSVARPGDQVNRSVNPGLLPVNLPTGAATGPAQPAFQFHTTDFWAQGLNVGLAFQW